MSSETTSVRAWLISALLGFVMAASTVTSFGLGVVAVEVIADLHISTVVFGILVASSTFGGALLSPFAGRIADKIGGRRAVVAVLALSAIGLALLGIAPTLSVMFAGTLVAAVGMALANPATNRVIAGHFAPGRRGWVTGIKQSGVQFAVFGAGVLLPLGATRVGWRGSMLVTAGVIAAAIPAVPWLIKAQEQPIPQTTRFRIALSPVVLYLSAYAFLVGFANSSRLFMPLFAQQELGVSLTLAGLSLGLVGLAAIFGRVLWARAAERRGDYKAFLMLFAALGAGAFGVVLASAALGTWWILAAGAILLGLSASSWNSVATLALLRTPVHQLGAASGTMMLGFFLGVGLGSPVYGAAIDITGEYSTVWGIAIVSIALAWLVIRAWPERTKVLSRSRSE